VLVVVVVEKVLQVNVEQDVEQLNVEHETVEHETVEHDPVPQF
jgi:hypothetical protein